MARSLRTFTALLILALPLSAAQCAQHEEAAEASEEQSLATVNGESISAAEVDELIAGDLARLRREEYEARRNALEQLISRRLLEKEAEGRGITTQELLQAEVEGKVSPPTDEQVKAYYDANQARMGGRTLDQVREDIRRGLHQQSIGTLGNQYLRGLMDRADVQIHLEEPRAAIQIPENPPTRGSEDAAVTVVEFSDFQCPYCRRAHPIVEEMLKTYGDLIHFVYLDYPLPNHPRAMPASQAARCAGEQGKYWEYHDVLMTGSGDLSDGDLKQRAASLGLDAEAFEACYVSGSYGEAIQTSAREGATAGVTGTPSFFINGRMMVGAQPLSEFRKVIDEELRRAGKTPPPAAP